MLRIMGVVPLIRWRMLLSQICSSHHSVSGSGGGCINRRLVILVVSPLTKFAIHLLASKGVVMAIGNHGGYLYTLPQ